MGSAVVGRNGPCLCAEGVDYYFHAKRPHPFSLHLTPTRLRIGDSKLLVCFCPSPISMARLEHQRRASAVHWWVGTVRVYVQKGWIKYIFPCKSNAPILATFDTNPSPHRRFNDPSLLLAFAHIHGEAGTPTEGIGSALWVGTVCFCFCACAEGVDYYFFHSNQTPPYSLHLTPPRLRIGESMILVCFWPSLISTARREHQRRALEVR
jgi:hypothetical protein